MIGATWAGGLFQVAVNVDVPGRVGVAVRLSGGGGGLLAIVICSEAIEEARIDGENVCHPTCTVNDARCAVQSGRRP